ncbi:MAG: vitamin K epoxide reductase family protein [Planctomycetota bacterium]
MCFILAGVGWLISAYFLLRLLQLDGTAGLDVCAVFGSNCDQTLGKSVSWQLGFPLAGWGVAYFAIVGVLLSWGGVRLLQAARLVTAAGAGASVILLLVLLQDPAHLCALCLVVQTANLLLAFSVGRLGAGLRGYGAPRSRGLAVLRRPLVTLGAVAVGAVCQLALMQYGRPGAALDPAAALSAYLAAERHEIPIEPGDPVLGGSVDAPARLVVFTSFQCPACQRFGQQTRYLKDYFGDRLSIVIKHFPLGTECNPLVRTDLQPRACDLSRAAEAARGQRRFWEFHEALFDGDLSRDEPALQAIATALDLDLERWNTDRSSAPINSRVKRDVALGLRLGVTETPALFLNGRRVPTISLPGVALLIKHQLESPAPDGPQHSSDAPEKKPTAAASG